MKYQKFLTCIIAFLFLFVVVACDLSNSTSMPLSVTSTIPNNLSPTPTKSPPPTTLSLTSLPPITSNTAKQVLAQFVRENGGCKLPCLLGLDPVSSNRYSVEAFSQYFQLHSQESKDQLDNVKIDGHYDQDSGSAWLVFWNNRVRVDVILGASIIKNEIEYISLSTGVYEHIGENVDERALILSSHPDYNELLGQFSLPRILIGYGPPTEIWVRAFPEDELGRSSYTTGSYPFDFVLIYPEQGFAVEYMARVKDESDGYLTGCPNTAYMNVASWNPDKNPKFKEIATYFEGTDSLSSSNFFDFKQIQEVTSLNVGDFYEQYKNPNFGECVKTPKHLWPNKNP